MATPKYTRNNAWNNGGTFDNQDLLWYAKGVAKMMSRPIADPQSWWFYAAIHGELADPSTAIYKYYQSINKMLWKDIQAPPSFSVTPLPSRTLINKYWNQCQHGSWYFLPWHRGYLLALEARLRQDIIDQGGPATWALPYWDYFGDNGKQNKIPPAFLAKQLPDKSPNPLYVIMRYGPNGDGDIFIPTKLSDPTIPDEDAVDQNTALAESQFTIDSEVEFGFGGPKTIFEHGGQHHGMLESNPHDFVHGYVGMYPDVKTRNQKYGLMGNPNTAALDPIFYVHHANIDRLWASWSEVGNLNPSESGWLNGPSKSFVMPDLSGNPWTYTPKDMVSPESLGYKYQELTPIPGKKVLLTSRLKSLNTPPELLTMLEHTAVSASSKPRTGAVELMGASTKNIIVQKTAVTAPVKLNKSVQKKSIERFESFKNIALVENASPAKKIPQASLPDSVYLKLENVTGDFDAVVLHVYVRSKADPTSGGLAGSVSLFGVSLASVADEKHGGQGLTFSLNITPIVDQLHLDNNFTGADLDVSIEPFKPLTPDKQVQIGRVSIYRKDFTA